MRRGVTLAAKLIVLLAVLTVGGTLAAEQTPSCKVTVQPGESIQAAIRRAPEGAVICLPAGEWRECLTISKSLALCGEGADATTIRGHTNDVPVIRVRRLGQQEVVVALDGLTVTGGAGENGAGIGIEDSAKATVTNCTVSGNKDDGIWLVGSAEATIANCTISENDTGIWLSDWSEATISDCGVSGNKAGFILWSRAMVRITNCSVSGNPNWGIWLNGSTYATVTGCSVSESSRCFLIEDSAEATITACTISQYFMGFEFRNSAQATITACAISNTPASLYGFTAVGVSLYGSAKVMIEGSSVSGSSYCGISLRDSTQVSIAGCSIDGNSVGVTLSNFAQATISRCKIHGGSWTGISLSDTSQASILDNRILSNGGYGIDLYSPSCHSLGNAFTGLVTGGGNTIPGPSEPDGNREGPVCPDELSFLMTEEGGELDMRK